MNDREIELETSYRFERGNLSDNSSNLIKIFENIKKRDKFWPRNVTNYQR